MKLTKKVIEKKYGVILDRDAVNMSDDYLSWTATAKDENGTQLVWTDTLKEIVEELEEIRSIQPKNCCDNVDTDYCKNDCTLNK